MKKTIAVTSTLVLISSIVVANLAFNDAVPPSASNGSYAEGEVAYETTELLQAPMPSEPGDPIVGEPDVQASPVVDPATVVDPASLLAEADAAMNAFVDDASNAGESANAPISVESEMMAASALAPTPASGQIVATAADFLAAVQNTTVSNVTLSGTISGFSKDILLNHPITIDGNGTLDLGKVQLNAGAFDLTIAQNVAVTSSADAPKPAVIGQGSFTIAANANVSVLRPVGRSTQHLISGFANYYFLDGSTFVGTARTNLAESNKGYAQTAILHSPSANNFKLAANANVTLTSDASGPEETHGSTALSLRKPVSGNLAIEVETGAKLSITAFGTRAYARDLAPVLILSPVKAQVGSSSTVIKGALDVYSHNGNGWYYQYIDYVTSTYDSFKVDGGAVNIVADGKRVVRKAALDTNVTAGEYAAFEHYGPTPFDLSIVNDGKMHVKTNGWRAFSLAGGTLASPRKTITVGGFNAAGSNGNPAGSIGDETKYQDTDYIGGTLVAEGGQFAIAAEGRTIFTLNVLGAGQASFSNTQDSTIYTVGQATYNVRGLSARLELNRLGADPVESLSNDRSLYGAIFHDAPLVGPLLINVSDGATMRVQNHLGSRAAITTQSHYMTTHKIIVNGRNSTLEVRNDNPAKATAGDTSLYPVGAIAFAANCSGDIEIRDGGNFIAQSNSPDSPTIALGSYGSHKYSGKLILNDPGLVDIQNNAAKFTNRAVALRGRNYDPNRAQTDTAQTLVANDVRSLSVFAIGDGQNGWTAAPANTWQPANFIAMNKGASTTGGATLNLEQVGRILAN